MLSGRSPFYSRTRTDSASHVMRRIKEGDFRLEGEPWSSEDVRLTNKLQMCLIACLLKVRLRKDEKIYKISCFRRAINSVWM